MLVNDEMNFRPEIEWRLKLPANETMNFVDQI